IGLMRYITRAESDIDAFLGFAPQNGGFEPHTVWIQEQFDARTLRTHSPNPPVPVRQIVRYRIQVSNLSGTGAGFFATINNADAAINVFDEYVEIVPLQSITYSLAPVLVQLGLRPPIVQMDVEIGYFLSSFGETLYATGVSGQYMSLRGFWASSYTQSLATQPNTLPPVPPVVYVNGVTQPGYTYSINYTEGQVTFVTPPAGNAVVTADITYTIPDPVRDACVDQVTYLLGKRRINVMGLTALGSVRSGQQEVRTIDAFPARFPTDTTPLCAEASGKLMQYKEIPIA
ncbi:MAG TPA: hypothetical protein VH593_04670, partial [Ktedonobacteraceae bacterium]